jgi:hypothetical protein
MITTECVKIIDNNAKIQGKIIQIEKFFFKIMLKTVC